MSRNAVSSGTANTGNDRSRASSTSARGTRWNTSPSPMPSALIPASSSSAIKRALRRRAPAQPHPGREHHPVALEEPGRRLDVDRVRARHLARQRVGPAGDERQAEVLGG